MSHLRERVGVRGERNTKTWKERDREGRKGERELLSIELSKPMKK